MNDIMQSYLLTRLLVFLLRQQQIKFGPTTCILLIVKMKWEDIKIFWPLESQGVVQSVGNHTSWKEVTSLNLPPPSSSPLGAKTHLSKKNVLALRVYIISFVHIIYSFGFMQLLNVSIGYSDLLSRMPMHGGCCFLTNLL